MNGHGEPGGGGAIFTGYGEGITVCAAANNNTTFFRLLTVCVLL